MASNKVGLTRGGVLVKPNCEIAWKEHSGDLFRCLVYLSPEPEGGFSVIAPMLPGAVSQGETETEALANITEALGAALGLYKESGKPIPWNKTTLEPEVGVLTRWVFVHV